MSFYTSLSGLKAAQTDLSTISNNVANVGYRDGYLGSENNWGSLAQPGDPRFANITNRPGPTDVYEVPQNASYDLNDLDLVVVCPGGQRIWYDRKSACGGELDLDRNLQPPFTPRAAENVVFGAEPAPGRYGVRVMNSANHPPSPGTSPFRVTIRVEGQPDRVVSGTAPVGADVAVTSFDVPSR